MPVLLGIGYEVLVVRVLSEVAENTVYTFAMLLAVYLIGTAIGVLHHGLRYRGDEPPFLSDRAAGPELYRHYRHFVSLLVR